jgi:DNA polymerase-3 subunit chi
MLWTQGKESFLPHGLASGPSPEAQPILLSEAAAPLNNARNVALADGVWRDEALAFERCFFFFDGERTQGAREAWRSLGSAEGVERRYWRQEAGKWVQGP